eukprot:CAMPEP_0117437782 /NCGR_PEP_ID=MMETSP0759-20121206/1709_1 /TAXON_ID=63605 /ORGANISM="Percolomonas cosmopolitus, Strain WS" /LENGTH=459 /DNA_ID=CAMNT_0005229441 /DNA_START=44 /DNA_END=1420 /DNA_ORIENTATION=+
MKPSAASASRNISVAGRTNSHYYSSSGGQNLEYNFYDSNRNSRRSGRRENGSRRMRSLNAMRGATNSNAISHTQQHPRRHSESSGFLNRNQQYAAKSVPVGERKYRPMRFKSSEGGTMSGGTSSGVNHGMSSPYRASFLETLPNASPNSVSQLHPTPRRNEEPSTYQNAILLNEREALTQRQGVPNAKKHQFNPPRRRQSVPLTRAKNLSPCDEFMYRDDAESSRDDMILNDMDLEPVPVFAHPQSPSPGIQRSYSPLVDKRVLPPMATPPRRKSSSASVGTKKVKKQQRTSHRHKRKYSVSERVIDQELDRIMESFYEEVTRNLVGKNGIHSAKGQRISDKLRTMLTTYAAMRDESLAWRHEHKRKLFNILTTIKEYENRVTNVRNDFVLMRNETLLDFKRFSVDISEASRAANIVLSGRMSVKEWTQEHDKSPGTQQHSSSKTSILDIIARQNREKM